MDGNNFENTTYDAGTVETATYDAGTVENTTYDASAYSYDSYEDATQTSGGNGLAIAAMIVGIASVVLMLLLGCCFGGIGTTVTIVSSIVGLVLSLKAKKKGQQTGLWLTGLICSIVALVISVLWTLLAIIVLLGYGAAYMSEYM